MVRTSHVFFGGVVALLTLSAVPATGQSTWNGNGGDNNWSTAGNWTGGTPSSAATTTVTLAGTNRLSPVQNIANPFMLNQLTFGSTAGGFSVGGNGLNFVS